MQKKCHAAKQARTPATELGKVSESLAPTAPPSSPLEPRRRRGRLRLSAAGCVGRVLCCGSDRHLVPQLADTVAARDALSPSGWLAGSASARAHTRAHDDSQQQCPCASADARSGACANASLLSLSCTCVRVQTSAVRDRTDLICFQELRREIQPSAESRDTQVSRDQQ